MEEKGKIESEIHLLQMLVTGSLSDLLSDETHESPQLPSCAPGNTSFMETGKTWPTATSWSLADGVHLHAGLSRHSAPIKHPKDNRQPPAPATKFPRLGSGGTRGIMHGTAARSHAQQHIGGKILRARLTPELTIWKDSALATAVEHFPTRYIVYSVNLITR